MTNGPYHMIGAKLVELGYAAIPIMPGTKRPGVKRGSEWVGIMDWRERWANKLPSNFETGVWAATTAGVCVVTGRASGHLAGVDIDSDDPEIINAILSVIPSSPVRKAGSKGFTAFYYAPKIENSRSFRPYVDLIGPGRQTVLPPTIHPDTGAPYRWLTTESLEDYKPGELPELLPEHIEAMGAALEAFGYAERKSSVAEADGDVPKPHRQLNDFALANLDLWVPKLGLYKCRRTRGGYEAVADWRESSTGQRIEQRKLNLKISPEGIRDFGVDRAYTPLDLWMRADGNGCELDEAFRRLSFAVGWGGMGEPITIGAVNGVRLDRRGEPGANGFPLVGVPKPAPQATDDFPDALTYPGGLVEDVINWITDTARQADRVLALGAAVTIVGTLIGRRACGPTRSATHLYVVTLAPSGAGKDHALSSIPLLLEAAGAKQHIGASQFISMPAVLNFVKRCPLSLCPQDEFGAFLKRVLCTRKASGFEQGITMVLRSLWGISFGGYPLPEWAGRPTEMVYTPAISICGASTPEEFYESLQGADIRNGFINRFLVIATSRNPDKREPVKAVGEVPEGLRERLAALYQWKPDAGNAYHTRINESSLVAIPEKLNWADDAAKATYEEFERSTHKRIQDDKEGGPFLARTAEMGLRLATIRAAGRSGREALIDAKDVEWGQAVADASASLMIAGAHRHMADNEQQAKHKMILRIIEEAGAITLNQLTRRVQGRIVAREKASILADLEEGGEIFKINDRSKGRPFTLYMSEKEHRYRPYVMAEGKASTGKVAGRKGDNLDATEQSSD